MQHGEENELVPLKTTFDMAWRGFDRDQVLSHLASIEEDIRTLVADRNASTSQVDDLTTRLESARGEIDELGKKIDALHRPPMNASDLGERLNRMLELANTEAAEVTARAQAAAEHTWTSAEEAAGKLRTRYQRMLTELDKQREEMAAEHKQTMAQAHADAEATTTEAERRRHDMDTAAEARRTEIEQRFEAMMTKRRTELDNEVAGRETSSKAEADKRIRDATAEADKRVRDAKADAQRRVAEATAEVERMQELRGKISQQLGGVLNLMRDARPLLIPADGEQPESDPESDDGQATARIEPVPDPRPRLRPSKQRQRATSAP